MGLWSTSTPPRSATGMRHGRDSAPTRALQVSRQRFSTVTSSRLAPGAGRTAPLHAEGGAEAGGVLALDVALPFERGIRVGVFLGVAGHVGQRVGLVEREIRVDVAERQADAEALGQLVGDRRAGVDGAQR